jgi:hypothetical protein
MALVAAAPSVRPTRSVSPQASPQPAARAAAAAPRSGSDDRFDGFLVGANGKGMRPGTPLESIPPVLATPDTPRDPLGLYINGVDNTAKDQADEMLSLSQKTGLGFLGVHNSTDGLLHDLGEAVAEKLGWSTRLKPTDELCKVILQRLDTHQPLLLFAHSQGALMLSEALKQAKQDLMKRGATQEQAETTMSAIQVETYASAAGSFPDGPKYVHYVNDADIVPRWFGTSDTDADERPAPTWGRWIDNAFGAVGIHTEVGSDLASKARDLVDEAEHPGRGAAVIHFKDAGTQEAPGESLPAHRLATYLEHRLPFEQAEQKATSNGAQ